MVTDGHEGVSLRRKEKRTISIFCHLSKPNGRPQTWPVHSLNVLHLLVLHGVGKLQPLMAQLPLLSSLSGAQRQKATITCAVGLSTPCACTIGPHSDVTLLEQRGSVFS